MLSSCRAGGQFLIGAFRFLFFFFDHFFAPLFGE
jgi:hypothetical protein